MNGWGTYVFAGLAIAWVVITGVVDLGLDTEARWTVAVALFGAAGIRLRAAVGRSNGTTSGKPAPVKGTGRLGSAASTGEGDAEPGPLYFREAPRSRPLKEIIGRELTFEEAKTGLIDGRDFRDIADEDWEREQKRVRVTGVESFGDLVIRAREFQGRLLRSFVNRPSESERDAGQAPTS